MIDSSSPVMSVVLVTPDRYETIRKTMKHLRAQTIRDRLEIVIVAPSAAELDLDKAELEDFLQYRVVEVGPIKSTAEARAAGVRRASAPIVAFTEDHSYPVPGWAQALVESHCQPWAVVGPVFDNGNPNSMTSWANLLVEYGEWIEPAAAGIISHLPPHNSSYKRALLLDYGSQLESMMEAETVLQWDLRAKGHQLYLQPAAKTYHTNFSSPLASIPLRFHCGRVFGASRARRWSPFRQMLFTAAAPMIPLVRLWRILRRLRRPGPHRRLLPRILPVLMAAFIVDAAGEMIGYALGTGTAMRRTSNFEFHRHRYRTRRDQETQGS